MSRSPPLFRSQFGSISRGETNGQHRRGNSYAQASTAPPVETVHRSQSSAATSQISTRGIRRFEQRRTMEQSHFLHSKARSLNLNPPVDMRLLDYVAPSDENLMCAICRCPFVDPVVLAECDHCLCRDCIRQTWTTSATPYNPLGPRGDCPTCRTPARLGPRSATSKILINILDDLVVKCPKSEEGCTAQLKRGEVQDHVSIYCGYALVECPREDCELPVLRRESMQGCLHYGVSCIACHEEMQKSDLETHWRSSCPDRRVTCALCSSDIFYRELHEHKQHSCPANSVTCPGKMLGCSSRSKRSLAEVHAKSCTFAKLAPIINAQNQRLDEQEAAQKQMSRKLEVLEDGFSAMQNIIYPNSRGMLSDTGENVGEGITGLESDMLDLVSTRDIDSPTSTIRTMYTAVPDFSSRAAPVLPEHTLEGAFLPDFNDEELAFPPPSTTGGPYVSPLHHLLSMHESLRDEMTRINAALQQLEGRQSMQILNENLRTREEITYIGAQVTSLQRQVHWLTSVQLQRQGRAGTPIVSGNGEGSSNVESAVSGVLNNAVGTAVRMAAAGSMRRQGSEEGRTKL